jgi:hypothetical protein
VSKPSINISSKLTERRGECSDCQKRPSAYRRRQISDSIRRLRLRDAIESTNLKRNKRAERVSP